MLAHVFIWSALTTRDEGNWQECTNVHMDNNNNLIPLSRKQQGGPFVKMENMVIILLVNSKN